MIIRFQNGNQFEMFTAFKVIMPSIEIPILKLDIVAYTYKNNRILILCNAIKTTKLSIILDRANRNT